MLRITLVACSYIKNNCVVLIFVFMTLFACSRLLFYLFIFVLVGSLFMWCVCVYMGVLTLQIFLA